MSPMNGPSSVPPTTSTSSPEQPAKPQNHHATIPKSLPASLSTTEPAPTRDKPISTEPHQKTDPRLRPSRIPDYPDRLLELIDIENPAALGRHCAPKWIGRIGRPQWQKAI